MLITMTLMPWRQSHITGSCGIFFQHPAPSLHTLLLKKASYRLILELDFCDAFGTDEECDGKKPELWISLWNVHELRLFLICGDGGLSHDLFFPKLQSLGQHRCYRL